MIRLWHAFLYSLAGLKSAFRDEAAFRQEVILAVVLAPLAFFIAASPLELTLLWGSLLLVLALELLNTGIEATIDRQSADIHPLAKKAKDTASAAVLVGLVNAALIWIVLAIW